jgi:hypothetical protein
MDRRQEMVKPIRQVTGYVGVAGVKTSGLKLNEILMIAGTLYEVPVGGLAEMAHAITNLGVKKRSELVRKNIHLVSIKIQTTKTPPAFGGNRKIKGLERRISVGAVIAHDGKWLALDGDGAIAGEFHTRELAWNMADKFGTDFTE